MEKVVATNKDLVIYKKESGDTNVELLLNGETLWVTQKTMFHHLIIIQHLCHHKC